MEPGKMEQEQPKNILFLCMGNVFRSASAEFSARKLNGSENGICFSSAGLFGKQGKQMRPDVIQSLEKRHIDPSDHHVRLLDQQILSGADLVVSMDSTIQTCLKDSFNHASVLFNALAYGQETDIPDLWEEVPDYKDNPEAAARYI